MSWGVHCQRPDENPRATPEFSWTQFFYIQEQKADRIYRGGGWIKSSGTGRKILESHENHRGQAGSVTPGTEKGARYGADSPQVHEAKLGLRQLPAAVTVHIHEDGTEPMSSLLFFALPEIWRSCLSSVSVSLHRLQIPSGGAFLCIHTLFSGCTWMSVISKISEDTPQRPWTGLNQPGMQEDQNCSLLKCTKCFFSELIEEPMMERKKPVLCYIEATFQLS